MNRRELNSNRSARTEEKQKVKNHRKRHSPSPSSSSSYYTDSSDSYARKKAKKRKEKERRWKKIRKEKEASKKARRLKNERKILKADEGGKGKTRGTGDQQKHVLLGGDRRKGELKTDVQNVNVVNSSATGVVSNLLTCEKDNEASNTCDEEEIDMLLEMSSSNNDEHSGVDAARNWRQTHTTREEKCKFVLDNQRFSDVTFLVGPEQEPVPGHKFPLMTASQVFQDIFAGDNNQHRNLKVTKRDPKYFRLMLEFVYTGSVDIKDLETADKLQGISESLVLPQLTTYSREYLWSHINVDNVWRMLSVNFEQSIKCVLLIIADAALRSKRLESLPLESFKSVVMSLASNNLDSESVLLDACVRWCRAELQRRVNEPNPPSLQEQFLPFREYIKFLKLTPQEFMLHVLNNDILPYTDMLAIISNILVPNSDVLLLPKYVNQTSTTACIASNVLTYVYGIKSCKFTPTGGLIDGSQQSIHDLISTVKFKVTSGDVLLGIKLSTQKLDSEGVYSYDEKLTVFVNDVQSGENIFSVTKREQLQPVEGEFEISFGSEGINFADYPRFITRNVSEIEIKIVPHRSGYYYFHNNGGKVCMGKFKGQNVCQLRYPPRHCLIICAAFANR